MRVAILGLVMVLVACTSSENHERVDPVEPLSQVYLNPGEARFSILERNKDIYACVSGSPLVCHSVTRFSWDCRCN